MTIKFDGTMRTRLVESDLGPIRPFHWDEVVRIQQSLHRAAPPSDPEDPHNWCFLTTVGALSKDMVVAFRCEQCGTTLRPVFSRQDALDPDLSVQSLCAELHGTHGGTVPQCSIQRLNNMARVVMES